MSLLDALPPPVHTSDEPRDEGPKDETSNGYYHGDGARPRERAPLYGRRTKDTFTPRSDSDYGDGGAYPEIHVAQYPLGIGRGGAEKRTLAPTVDEQGKANHDAIVKQGTDAARKVHNGHDSLKPKLHEETEESLQKETEAEAEETAQRTNEALQAKVNKKLAAVNPKNVPGMPGPAEYINYTPSTGGERKEGEITQRVIEMKNVQEDPLEPPKFLRKKMPQGPGSPPAPVLHSPPRKVTKEEVDEWKIPPCISNWRNPKGFTIPLDKRLAADGRGLEEVQINDKFAKLSETMYVAEQKARESVDTRAKLQREQLASEKRQNEERLRNLAEKARMERGDSNYNNNGEQPSEEVHKNERDELREQRRKERERERRREERQGSQTATSKRTKLTRDRERDVGEKIALGQADVSTANSESMFDQRLFNQEAGLGSGFGNDDEYNAYEGRLFTSSSHNYYRPPHQSEASAGPLQSEGSGPAEQNTGGGDGDDPFGLGQFLSEARRGDK